MVDPLRLIHPTASALRGDVVSVVRLLHVLVMSRYRRLYVPGGTYHFVVCLADRSRTTLTDELDAFTYACRAVRAKRPFRTLAMSVMPDHAHMIWTLPPDDDDFSTRLRLIKHGFVRRLNTGAGRRPGERDVFQRRFWEHAIRGDDALNRHVAYVHWNPVKHGLVTDPDDWAPSTWHRWKTAFGRAAEPDKAPWG